ncbi:HAD family hydrolase [Oscillospiraceae bacterium MB08-C2-2]|nr:HAD family hydrolase [Oscillospiraceae bacterium MB08-C2-2]
MEEKFKETLYITDLDGTLLGEDGVLSAYSRDTINQLVEQGVLFSVATARTLHSAWDVVGELNLQLPVVLMNGVLIYDLQKEQYLQVNHLPQEQVDLVIDLLQKLNMGGFMYALDGNTVKVYYNSTSERDQRNPGFYKERTEWGGRVFIPQEDFREAARDQRIIYFTLYGDLEAMHVIYDEIRKMPELGHTFCEDIYDGRYFLEIFNPAISKAAGADFIKKWCAAKEVVAFGDNQNDLEMLEWADRSYVPENGIRIAKRKATQVLGPCGEDCVARFIEQETGALSGRPDSNKAL